MANSSGIFSELHADNTSAFNSTAAAADTAPSASEIIPILILLTAAIFVAVFGNGFTIYAFLRFPELRTPFNTFIFNLAIADFFVGIIVMPSFAVYNYYGHWPLGEPLCSVWIFTDWFMTFESVTTLAVISVERLWSIRWPLHYQRCNGPRNIMMIILTTWAVVMIIWLPGYVLDRMRPGNVVEDCAWDPAKNYTAGVCVGLLGYLIPCSLMLLSYAYVGWSMRKRLRNVLPTVLGGGGTSAGVAIKPNQRNKWVVMKEGLSAVIHPANNLADRRTSRADAGRVQRALTVKSSATSRDKSVLLTLGAIVVAFTVCWIPFYIYFFVSLFQWDPLPGWFGTLTYWTAYLNSAANPILYTALHRDFRRKFLDTVRIVLRKRPVIVTNNDRCKASSATHRA